MRSKPLLPALLLVGAGLSPLAQASSDDSCYPDWSLVGGGVCDTLPFLAPGNDTRANLRLLLADAGHWRLVEAPPSEEEKLEGYGLVPFGLFRLLPGDGSQPPAPPAASEAETPPPAPAPSPLAELARQMGAEALPEKIAGAEFFEGEGSRCRSNDQDSALAFLRQVRDAGLGEAETKALANSRLDLLGACGWEQEELGGVLAQGVESAAGKAFATYLEAAANFYSGRFDEAEQGFKALQDVSQPWLKETALYLQARTLLNAAQQNAFDDMGFPELQNVDKARLEQTRSALEAYLQAYPKGLYAASAKGLQRRVHWLAGDQKLLAQDYAAQFAEAEQGQRNMPLEDLVQEVDNKLLTGIQLGDIQTPLLLAVADLVQMRAHDPSTPRSFTWETLQAQQASFAAHPELFAYLQAAYRFYVDQDPAKTLEALPQKVGSLDYVGFSQQTLRGLALEQQKDWKAAEALWLELLPQAAQPYQKGQLQLALALNYERSGQLEKVFAEGSPVQEPLLRSILLRNVADAALLRRQAKQGATAEERDTALFTLLYKDLRRSRFADFGKDFALLGETPSQTKLGTSLGYVYGAGNSLELFRWKGDKAESGYVCPAIAESAAALAADDKDPKGLNCLGEFILRNGLDGMPLDSQPEANELGGTPSGFKGEVYSRLDGYRLVMDNPKAPREDKAYALFRAINCFAPAGYNTCGQQDIPQAERKQWFRTLKSTYADSSWAKELKYYW
ncbi:TPA: outer membrane assembly lipoprotein YfiO [Pseudomonas aeruginosa]|uniref:outer membrane assembly lipoprotein YfiO n=1 Tax=Pseudomonas aeruginosa TaxID=287 RepID=UPI000EB13CA8|nr:outer membrane assembly lipoprotein YfiO [Pseudomonas aeruginosa]MBY9118634.1 outer membrane assembly lipoprotein YfiO [Pseudomonas aeruginosa]MCT5736336.1 outer membrane assembly lipoprotein YfiO [Pseudomonas aeruginosa]MCV0145450.1 outer membrane assembly lipoprotein YfiO [Pseudomonas aeruginosa]MCV0347539.1 outer membrane assembly lipoprotein YfiO [Pseudomonas aeruginosa]MDP5484240.1 outer membrane assembly lipoprotein YfiO [Pseudomonas aeruginosa]